MFEPLAKPAFRRYMAGQSVSLVGTFLQSTAQSLLVFKLSGGQASALGVLALSTALPMILLSPVAGTIVDSCRKRPLIIATQAAEMLLAFCLAWMAQAGVGSIGYVYALAAGLGACEALYFPAHQTYLAALAGPGRVRSALGLNAVVINTCRFLGPALAGMLVARLGVPCSFWLNGFSFLAVIATVALASDEDEPALAVKTERRHSAFSVFDSIIATPHMWRLYLNVILINAFGQSIYTLIPALVEGRAEDTGWLLASTGAGSLVAALGLLPLLNERERPAGALSALLIWMGSCLLAGALIPVFGLRLLCFFGAGMSTSTLIPTVIGLVQVTTPIAMRGRMVAVMTMVHLGMVPLAASLLGTIADLSTPSSTAAVSAAMLTLAGLALAADRRWRSWTPKDWEP